MCPRWTTDEERGQTVKAVLDSVQGIVIEDDRLIVAIWAAFVPTIRP